MTTHNHFSLIPKLGSESWLFIAIGVIGLGMTQCHMKEVEARHQYNEVQRQEKTKQVELCLKTPLCIIDKHGRIIHGVQ